MKKSTETTRAGKDPNPEEIDTLVSMFAQQRYFEVEPLARRLTEHFPKHGFGWKLLGAVLNRLGRHTEVLEPKQKAAALSPDDAEAHNNLANTLRDLGQLDTAVVSHRRALEITPDYAEAHNNLGNVLRDIGQFDAAVASCCRALAIKPDYLDALNNLASTLQDLGHLDNAVKSYRRALEINPGFAEAHNNLGLVLKDLGRIDNAIACLRHAMEIQPDYADAHSNRLFIHHYQSDQPAAMALTEAQRYGDLVARRARPPESFPNVPEPDRCLQIGLVSGDLRHHPVGFFVEGVLAALASNAAGRLELIAYSNHARTDAVTERIKACCQAWHSVVGLSDEALAQRIRDDGIDILIDLSGHSALNRLSMFAWKPAPVQISWLGYFATTGVEAIDYLLADPWTLPKSEEVHFTEKIWRLPETRLCFTAPNVIVDISPLPALSNGHITFGCFNSLAKMNDSVVALWARVLSAIPGSRLFLKAYQLMETSVQQSTVERFAARGIDACRLILDGYGPRTEYLAAYNQVDIALDPFPFPGGTTTVESLWMGVPVLTLAGEHFISRQGIGILMNVGLPEWIATDENDYVARAVLHGSDLQGLAQLRNGLRQQVLASPIFDAPRFAWNLEAALRGMWMRWCHQQ